MATFLTLGLGGLGFFMLRGVLWALIGSKQGVTGSFLVAVSGFLLVLSTLAGASLVLVHQCGWVVLCEFGGSLLSVGTRVAPAVATAVW
jgi:hypothetical protein